MRMPRIDREPARAAHRDAVCIPPSICDTGACDPVSAATTAFCVIDDTLDVEWLCSACCAPIAARRAERPAAAPAGHRVGLRRRPADDAEVLAVPLDDGRQVVRRRVVDQLLVTEVDHQPDAPTRRLPREGDQLVLRHQRAGRIARRVEDDAPGPRGDRVDEQAGAVSAKPSSADVRTTTGVASASFTCSVSVGQSGRVRDDLVAGIEQRQRRVVKRLLAARRGDDFVLADTRRRSRPCTAR